MTFEQSGNKLTEMLLNLWSKGANE
jgi:hypothetical protein